MYLSAFNRYYPSTEQPGTTLVHNAFTGGFAELDDDVLARLRSGTPAPDLDPELFDPAVGVLVADLADEERRYRAWYEEQRSSTAVLSAIVSTTLACNFDCSYCCQHDVMSGASMSDELGRMVSTWLAERALAIGATNVSLTFVGGEPLLHPHRIEQIVDDVRTRLGDAATVSFGLITNGVFLTAELVDAWVPLGLRSVQITLDGDETTNGLTRRPARAGDDHFATIFANLLAASQRVRVVVNGNYQADTLHGFAGLLEDLRAAGLPAGTLVTFSPALATLAAPASSGSGSCHLSDSKPEYMVPLFDRILREGFDPGDALQIGPCGFHTKHTYAIDPHGHIYKCPGFLGMPAWAIGDVHSGLTRRYDQFVTQDLMSTCGACSHRPDCGGGCIASEWTRSGQPEGVSCERDFFERLGADFVARKLALATAETADQALAQFPPARVELPVQRGRRSAQLRVL